MLHQTHTRSIVYEKYISEPTLCIYSHLTRYIELTAPLRGATQQLLISFNRPHQAVSVDTISQWCKDFLKQASIDMSKYKGPQHSHCINIICRTCCYSDLTRILLAAGWTSEDTFRRFYDLPCGSSFNLGSTLLCTLE